MGREKYAVYSKGRIRNLTLKNRLIRSATCEYKVAEDGTVPELMTGIYRRLAEGGISMVITGLMAISQSGKGVNGQACIWNDKFIPEIAKLADAVHGVRNGCHVVAKLCHTGRQLTHETTTADCVGPSFFKAPFYPAASPP